MRVLPVPASRRSIYEAALKTSAAKIQAPAKSPEPYIRGDNRNDVPVRFGGAKAAQARQRYCLAKPLSTPPKIQATTAKLPAQNFQAAKQVPVRPVLERHSRYEYFWGKQPSRNRAAKLRQ